MKDEAFQCVEMSSGELVNYRVHPADGLLPLLKAYNSNSSDRDPVSPLTHATSFSCWADATEQEKLPLQSVSGKVDIPAEPSPLLPPDSLLDLRTHKQSPEF